MVRRLIGGRGWTSEGGGGRGYIAIMRGWVVYMNDMTKNNNGYVYTDLNIWVNKNIGWFFLKGEMGGGGVGGGGEHLIE